MTNLEYLQDEATNVELFRLTDMFTFQDCDANDLDDYANNVARLMRHLQTKSLNKEERETQINKDYLIDKYSRELAIELVKVDKIVKEVHARCQALVA